MTMPTFLQPPKPGRPKRNPIDVLRTKVWFYAVKARSGLPSAYAIELAIEPSIVKHKEAGVVRPRKWDGYQTGLRVPRRMVGKPYSVDIADQNYPGTASYFDSPIWAVLRGDQLNQRWIDDQLKALAPAITDLLMVSAPPMLQAIPQPDRFQKFDEKTAYRCLSTKLSAFLNGHRHFFWRPQMLPRRVQPDLFDVLPVARLP